MSSTAKWSVRRFNFSPASRGRKLKWANRRPGGNGLSEAGSVERTAAMNLGDIFIKTAAAIFLSACLASLLVALILRYAKKARWWISLTVFVVLAPVLTYAGLYFGHHPLFVAWHRSQNEVLPRTGCLTYEPSFLRLHASYRMSRAEFDAWIKNHPWRLSPYDVSPIPAQDAEDLGISRPDTAFATERAPSGKQLRVYYKNGTMYVSYWAM
jgi:hypothetical protein